MAVSVLNAKDAVSIAFCIGETALEVGGIIVETAPCVQACAPGLVINHAVQSDHYQVVAEMIGRVFRPHIYTGPEDCRKRSQNLNQLDPIAWSINLLEKGCSRQNMHLGDADVRI